MTNDTLVLVEWYDLYIPPRHHMAVVHYGNALAGLKSGYAIAIHPIDPKVLIDERRAAATDSPPSTRR